MNGMRGASIFRAVVSIAAVAASVVCVATAFAARPQAPIAESDRQFIEQAAMSGRVDVALGKLSQERAATDRVKELGLRLSKDRAKSNDELKALASARGVDLSTLPDPKSQPALAKLKWLAGAGFDSAYLADRVTAREGDVALFQKEAASGRDAGLKTFAAQTLPMLREHLKLAQTTQSASIGKPASPAK